METMSLDAFKDALKAQGVPREHLAFKCPMCGTVQSMKSFHAAGVDEETAERQIGFSCVGRHTDAGSPRKKPDGKPCDWTLGGLFKLHKIEVITPDGEKHPRFELATPDEARTLMGAQP